MDKPAREVAMRQGVVLPETPRLRRERAALEEDLRTIPLQGRPLPLRARHGRPTIEGYLVATRGPLPYMARLREIEHMVEAHEITLRTQWLALAVEHRDDAATFAAAWRARAADVVFDEVNELIERHNLWYPVESRLPMDPRTGDYVLVNGRSYRLAPLDASWVIERYPAELSAAQGVEP